MQHAKRESKEQPQKVIHNVEEVRVPEDDDDDKLKSWLFLRQMKVYLIKNKLLAKLYIVAYVDDSLFDYENVF